MNDWETPLLPYIQANLDQDLDRSALEKLVVGSVASVRRRYGHDGGA